MLESDRWRLKAAARPDRTGWIKGALLGLAILFPAGNAAAQDNTLDLLLMTRADDNIPRTSDVQKSQFSHDGSDIVNDFSVTGAMDRKWNQLDVTLSGTAGRSEFLFNSQYDETDFGGQIELKYQAANGSLDALGSFYRRPISFDSVDATVSLHQHLTNGSVMGTRQVLGAIRLVANVAYQRNQVDGVAVLSSDAQAYSGGGGVGYYSPTGNFVTLEINEKRSRSGTDRYLYVNGDILGYLPSFNESSILSHIYYVPNDIIHLEGGIGYTRHNDLSVLNSDFHGLTADLLLTWSPAAEYQVTGTVHRGYQSQEALFSNGIQVSDYKLQAKGPLGARANWLAFYLRENRLYRYNLESGILTSAALHEHTNRVGAGLSYRLGLGIDAKIQYEWTSRRSQLSGYTYNDNAVTLSLAHAINL